MCCKIFNSQEENLCLRQLLTGLQGGEGELVSKEGMLGKIEGEGQRVSSCKIYIKVRWEGKEGG